jgi:hypothetical protein
MFTLPRMALPLKKLGKKGVLDMILIWFCMDRLRSKWIRSSLFDSVLFSLNALKNVLILNF